MSAPSQQLSIQQQVNAWVQKNPILTALLSAAGAAVTVRYLDRHGVRLPGDKEDEE